MSLAEGVSFFQQVMEAGILEPPIGFSMIINPEGTLFKTYRGGGG